MAHAVCTVGLIHAEIANGWSHSNDSSGTSPIPAQPLLPLPPNDNARVPPCWVSATHETSPLMVAWLSESDRSSRFAVPSLSSSKLGHQKPTSSPIA